MTPTAPPTAPPQETKELFRRPQEENDAAFRAPDEESKMRGASWWHGVIWTHLFDGVYSDQRV